MRIKKINYSHIVDSPSSSRLYEFGYAYDNDANQQNRKNIVSNHSHEQFADNGSTMAVVKTSPNHHFERNKSHRDDTNSLSRKHLEKNRKTPKENHR